MGYYGLLWVIMEYYGLLWNELLWIIMDYNRLLIHHGLLYNGLFLWVMNLLIHLVCESGLVNPWQLILRRMHWWNACRLMSASLSDNNSVP